MRVFGAFALAALVLAGPTARADEHEGSIGIIIRISDDGKLVIMGLIKDSPADKAGIKPGDTLVKAGDFTVKAKDATVEDLDATVKAFTKQKPGDKIKVTVKRDGKDQTMEVTVGKRKELFPDAPPVSKKDDKKDKPKKDDKKDKDNSTRQLPGEPTAG